jgi:hypothetical protein
MSCFTLCGTSRSGLKVLLAFQQGNINPMPLVRRYKQRACSLFVNQAPILFDPIPNLSNLFTGDLSSLAYVDTNDQPTFWSTQSACATGFDCIGNQTFFKLVRPYFEQTIPVNAHMQRALFDVAGNPTNIYMELAKAYAMSLQGE